MQRLAFKIIDENERKIIAPVLVVTQSQYSLLLDYEYRFVYDCTQEGFNSAIADFIATFDEVQLETFELSKYIEGPVANNEYIMDDKYSVNMFTFVKNSLYPGIYGDTLQTERTIYYNDEKLLSNLTYVTATVDVREEASQILRYPAYGINSFPPYRGRITYKKPEQIPFGSSNRGIELQIGVIPDTYISSENTLIIEDKQPYKVIRFIYTFQPYDASGKLEGSYLFWYLVEERHFIESDSIDFNGLPVPGSPQPPETEEDPYEQGGESEPGGGEGDFDNESEEVEIPELPVSSSVANTGFITLYDATVSELNSLASYLWSPGGLDLETFKKVFADPISAVLGLSIFPIPPEVGLDVSVILGNIDTGINMRKITYQYRRFDCGTLNINEYWGGYLDYSPYTSIEIFLPYIGTRSLNTDDVMGKAVHLVYHIDFLSGSCCAILEVNGTVLYQFMGQCSCPVPVTGRDMTNLVNGVLSVVGAGVGTLVATGGNLATAGAATIGSLASHVTSSKPKVEKTGAMGGMGGMLGVRTPYITITRPRQALPAAQNRYTGYPSYISTMIGELTGYTVMAEVHLKEMTATEEEKTEIENLLKSGVIL